MITDPELLEELLLDELLLDELLLEALEELLLEELLELLLDELLEDELSTGGVPPPHPENMRAPQVADASDKRERAVLLNMFISDLT